MGQLKALLPWNGTPLIEHQIAALQGAGVDLVVVVLGHEAHRLKALVGVKEGVTCVVNPDYEEGKTTSIKAGLNALGHEEPAALVVLNVDQPRTADT
ncbi:MAG: NTP transferase domain-containing protein, partial [candidate division NC10 bacterium]